MSIYQWDTIKARAPAKMNASPSPENPSSCVDGSGAPQLHAAIITKTDAVPKMTVPAEEKSIWRTASSVAARPAMTFDGVKCSDNRESIDRAPGTWPRQSTSLFGTFADKEASPVASARAQLSG
jgi:hypothetical protein